MVSQVIIFVLILGVAYYYYTTPKTEDHKALLLENMRICFAPDEERCNRS